MHRITTICFDLDNTLWDVWPAIVRAEQQMYAFLAERFPRVTAKYSVDAMRAERERAVQDEPHMSHDFTYLRIATLKRCAREVGYDESLAQEAFDVFYRARNAVSLYREVLPALEELRQHYRLLTLTNGNADLTAIGLDHFFSGQFTAREIGVLKPDPQAFHHVLQQSQLKAHEVVYVGDDPKADVLGARGVGMHCVWMNRDGARWSNELGPTPLAVSRLDELLPLLKKIVL